MFSLGKSRAEIIPLVLYRIVSKNSSLPVVVGGRLLGDAWCGMQLSTPQFRGVLHKSRIGIVPDPFLVKAVWLRETIFVLCYSYVYERYTEEQAYILKLQSRSSLL